MRDRGKLQYSAVFPAQFVKEAVISSVYIFGFFVENQLSVDVEIYFWVLYSVPSVHVSVFMPIPCCFGYYGFVVCLFFSLNLNAENKYFIN
jgi:hypothetical protein